MVKSTELILFQGEEVKLYLYYNRVLECFRIFQRSELDDWGKLDLVMTLLTNDNRSIRRWPVVKQTQLYQQLFEQKINLNRRKGKPGPRTVDFDADFDLIYAGFMQAYGLDLFKERDRLTWVCFFMLFQGLEGTKLNDVMAIRGRELPAPTSYNQKEIQGLLELKQYWALPPEAGLQDNYQEQVSVMFQTLKRMAGGESNGRE